jgi:hypothetical protein
MITRITIFLNTITCFVFVTDIKSFLFGGNFYLLYLREGLPYKKATDQTRGWTAGGAWFDS